LRFRYSQEIKKNWTKKWDELVNFWTRLFNEFSVKNFSKTRQLTVPKSTFFPVSLQKHNFYFFCFDFVLENSQRIFFFWEMTENTSMGEFFVKININCLQVVIVFIIYFLDFLEGIKWAKLRHIEGGEIAPAALILLKILLFVIGFDNIILGGKPFYWRFLKTKFLSEFWSRFFTNVVWPSGQRSTFSYNF